jgi:AbrB family looped-hinge helix DNA binding protein
MSELIQLRRKSQLTLPLAIRKELKLEEGDYLDVRIERGEIILKAKRLIDKDQAWFWSDRWQQGEIEAQADITSGRVNKFSNAESAIDFLHNQLNKNQGQKKTG